MLRVIKNEIKEMYAVWEKRGSTWERISAFYYCEENAIRTMQIIGRARSE